VWQTDFLEHLDSRLVVPLEPRLGNAAPVLRLNPVVTVDGIEYVVLTQYASAVAVGELSAPIASLREHYDAIRDAFDFLTTGF
jgi:toxin CcdB